MDADNSCRHRLALVVITSIRQNATHARQITTVRIELTNIFAQLVKAHLVGDVAAARFAHSGIIHHTLDQRSAQNVHERAGRYPPDRATVPIPGRNCTAVYDRKRRKTARNVCRIRSSYPTVGYVVLRLTTTSVNDHCTRLSYTTVVYDRYLNVRSPSNRDSRI